MQRWTLRTKYINYDGSEKVRSRHLSTQQDGGFVDNQDLYPCLMLDAIFGTFSRVAGQLMPSIDTSACDKDTVLTHDISQQLTHHSVRVSIGGAVAGVRAGSSWRLSCTGHRRPHDSPVHDHSAPLCLLPCTLDCVWPS